MLHTSLRLDRPNRLDKLLATGFELRPYSALDLPFKLALAHYLAIDSPAWAAHLMVRLHRPSAAQARATLAEALPRLEAAYGTRLFGVAHLDPQVLKAAVMKDPELADDFPSWDSYHAWYTSYSDMPQHPAADRWPVILSSDDRETLQEGWHRLHCYLRRGDNTIPAVFFPQPRHLACHQALAVAA